MIKISNSFFIAFEETFLSVKFYKWQLPKSELCNIINGCDDYEY